jgi:hypothetical protein
MWKNVETAPPRKPSRVLLGLNLIKGVRPKVLPEMNAHKSLHAITNGTKIAQNIPTWYCCYPPTILRETTKAVIMANANLANWYFKASRFRSKQNHNRIRMAFVRQIETRYSNKIACNYGYSDSDKPLASRTGFVKTYFGSNANIKVKKIAHSIKTL